MNNKLRITIGVVIITVFGYIAWSSFSEQITPYVDFRAARDSGRSVQVIGELVNSYSKIDSVSGMLKFSLREKKTGELLEVEYTGGPKPANFEQADKIVAIGRYNEGIFHSNQLLIKCPSKYQGLENENLEGIEHGDT